MPTVTLRDERNLVAGIAALTPLWQAVIDAAEAKAELARRVRGAGDFAALGQAAAERWAPACVPSVNPLPASLRTALTSVLAIATTREANEGMGSPMWSRWFKALVADEFKNVPERHPGPPRLVNIPRLAPQSYGETYLDPDERPVNPLFG